MIQQICVFICVRPVQGVLLNLRKEYKTKKNYKQNPLKIEFKIKNLK